MTVDGQVQCNLETSAALDIEHGICPQPTTHPPSPSAPGCPTAHLNKWALAVQGVLAPANAKGIQGNVVGTEQKHKRPRGGFIKTMVEGELNPLAGHIVNYGDDKLY